MPTLCGENVRIKVVAGQGRANSGNHQPVQSETEKRRNAEEHPHSGGDDGKRPEDTAVRLSDLLGVLRVNLGTNGHSRLLETEGVGELVGGCNCPPSQSREIPSTKVLHHVKIAGVHENHENGLHNGVGHKQTAEKVNEDSNCLRIILSTRLLP